MSQPKDKSRLWSVRVPPGVLSEEARRIMTASCRDADHLPRVEGAGEVFETADGERIQVMHNGIKVIADAYCGPWTTRLISDLRGVHEPQEEAVFHALMAHVPERATMIEIGAFWTYYSLWFLSAAPESRTAIGLEPDPAHLEVGRRNCALNGLCVDYHMGRIAAADAPPAPFKTEASGVIDVEAVSLAGLMDRTGTAHADIVLCDAQGGEIDMLMGMEDLVDQRRIGVALISTHGKAITGSPLTHQHCLHLVDQLGGTVLVEHDVHESYSGDGLIVANFGPPLAGWIAPRISFNRYSTSLFRNPIWDLARKVHEKK